jgi:predicted dehydrogenase
VHDDWQEIVEAADIDAVCIGTWPYMHSVMSIAALERGKHVLCEARMAMNAGEGWRMLEASRRAPHLIAQLVPAPHTLEVDATIQTLLGEGFVGEVLAVELQASGGRFVEPDAPLTWRQDIGLSGHNILNMGIWYEAMMRWLGPAQRVTAMTKVAVSRRKDGTGAPHDVRVPDHVDILAQFRGGAVGHLRFSSVTGLSPASEAWIFGSEGTLRLEADTLRLTGGRRGESALREIPVPPKTRIGWRVEEEFVNAIRGREKIARTSFEDGVRYMEFTDAVTRSASTGQTVDVKDL